MPRPTPDPAAQKVGRTKALLVRLTPGEHARWTDAAYEARESVSDLVRGAVEAELVRREAQAVEERRQAEAAPDLASVSEQLEALLERASSP